MREIALADARHPDVGYRAGSAENLPVADGTADYALLLCSWHHVGDKPRAISELARVLRPGGRLLLRANFSDHHPRPQWLQHFPHGYEADASIFQPLHEVIETFTTAGWRVQDYRTVTEPSAGTRAHMLERLQLRALSFFAQLDPNDLDVGFQRLTKYVERDPSALAPVFAEPLLTLHKP